MQGEAALDDRRQTPRKHVFAVNSSPDFLLIIRELLEDEGYAVTTCDFAPNVFTRIVMRQPDALIIDVAVGETAGWDLLDGCTRNRPRPTSRCWSPPPVPSCWSRRSSRQTVWGEPLVPDEADGPRRAPGDGAPDDRRRLVTRVIARCGRRITRSARGEGDPR